MQFTKAEEYGIMGVMYLADKAGAGVTPLSEVAKAEDIPEKFLAKIFQSLSRAGIVRSHRGVRGGFSLAADPDSTSMKTVLEAIQGPYHLLKCIPNPDICTRDTKCAVRSLVMIAEERLVSAFEQYTLADMCEWQRSGHGPH